MLADCDVSEVRWQCLVLRVDIDSSGCLSVFDVCVCVCVCGCGSGPFVLKNWFPFVLSYPKQVLLKVTVEHTIIFVL